MQTLVALDLETTGLDPARDAVIEIGAVRFRGPRVEAEWTSLVNPGRPVPRFVAQLTGIDDSMLSAAPRLASVLGPLREFVGDDPVLGHSIRFDLSFLQPRGLLLDNMALDTYDLASVLLPSAARYRLASLASELGIPSPVIHRAMPDAHTTRAVYLRLLERAAELPPWLVAEIGRLGAEVDWGAGWIFDELLRGLAVSAEEVLAPPGALYQFPRLPDWPLLEPVEAPAPLDAEELAAVLEPGGEFARSFPNFEHRAQQVSMLRAVAQALSRGRHMLIEAGTGTGKSMAYLLPALEWARTTGNRVVVSTNTLNLQDQLLRKDVPDLQRVLGHDYRAALLKGRSNYLCLRKLEALRRLGPRSAEEMRLLAKVLVWFHHGGTGDRTEINVGGGAEAAVWSRLSAEPGDCNEQDCRAETRETCPYHRARTLAEGAHVLIVNHALLLADIATGLRVLPDYQYLIVDEAHHLEAATTHGLSAEVDEASLHRGLRDLASGAGGVLGPAIAWLRAAAGAAAASEAEEQVRRIAARASECLELSRRLFEAASRLLASRREGQDVGPFNQTVRLLPATRSLAEWSDIEVAWDNLKPVLSAVIAGAGEVGETLASSDLDGRSAGGDLTLALRASVRELDSQASLLDAMIFEPRPHMIYWLEAVGANARVTYRSAPLEVGPLLERHLWHEKEAIVMTSATLTTAGEFDYLRRRLGADEADELALGSPVDFETSTLLYLVTDIPEPAPSGTSEGRTYQAMIEQGLIDLVTASRGRALVLFTSYDQLRRTALAVSDRLAARGILVLEQGDGASRYSLLETFRASEQAVLLGTRSFWEGVDVPGEALSVLVLARLPFDVPTDPIIAARAETYESPFDEYTLPEAILRFRQGFGRLIRTRSDRGVVAAFDRRLLSKRYGTLFLESLPACTVRRGRMADLPRAAARWLGEGSLAPSAAPRAASD
jgi:DNA polymerase-3 subunit epsilon/ATP-dependent DNA helicase DinG